MKQNTQSSLTVERFSMSGFSTGGTTPYASIPIDVLHHPDLSHGALALYMVICAYSDGDGDGTLPPLTELGAGIGKSVHSVRRYLAALQDAGVLTLIRELAPEVDPHETWKDVVGYEGLYEVSDKGRVRSLPRYNAAGCWLSGRILKQPRAPKGYRIVTLTRYGVQKVAAVHVLVATAFHGPKPEGMICCHYDDDKDNNAATNLRWDTYEANAADRRRNLGAYLP